MKTNARRLAVVQAMGWAIALTGMSTSVMAAYPEQPIIVMVGFSAGGGADTLARLVAKAAEKTLGQPLVIENVAGGGGVVAATKLKHAKPDGYTIGMSVTSTFSYAPLASQTVKYEVADFDYVSSIAALQNAVITRADAPFSTFQEMVAYGKSHGPLTFASSSPVVKLTMDYTGSKTGIAFNIVPVKGGAEVIKDVMGGHMDVGWSAGIHQKFGDKIKVIAAVGAKRLASSPEVPTLRELGVDIGSENLFLFFAPKGMPAERLARLTQALADAAQDPQVKALAQEKMGFPVDVVTGADLRAHVDESVENYRRLLGLAK